MLCLVSQNTRYNPIAGESHLVSRAFACHPTLAFQRGFQENKKRSHVREVKGKKSQWAQILYFILQETPKPWSAYNRSDLLQPAVQAQIIIYCWVKLDTMRSVRFRDYLAAFTKGETFGRRETGTKVELCLDRNDCVPISHVHVVVWGCTCFKVWATEAKTVIQNMPFSASLVLGINSVLESRSVYVLVFPVFSLGLKPAVAGSLLIITHCFSMQRACL